MTTTEDLRAMADVQVAEPATQTISPQSARRLMGLMMAGTTVDRVSLGLDASFTPHSLHHSS